MRRFAEHADIPIAMTLLGIGGFPASHPLYLGMMGMHGEAWVNTAIQEADLLIALGMRFDDRVTGNLKTYALNAEEDPRRDRPRRDQQERQGGRRPRRRPRPRSSPTCCRACRPATAPTGAPTSTRSRATRAVRDIQNLPDSGHLYAAHVIHDLWRETKGEAVVVTDVGQHQMWEAQYYHHDTPRTLITSGGLGTMGFALPAAIGAKIARPDAEVWVVAGDGGFQMTMARAGDDRPGEARHQGRDHQQRLPRHGAPVAGVLLRATLRRHADARAPTSSSWPRPSGSTAAASPTAASVVPAVQEARAHKGTVVIDFRVEQEDTVYPMVPAGADLHAMIRRPSVLAETGADQ